MIGFINLRVFFMEVLKMVYDFSPVLFYAVTFSTGIIYIHLRGLSLSGK